MIVSDCFTIVKVIKTVDRNYYLMKYMNQAFALLTTMLTILILSNVSVTAQVAEELRHYKIYTTIDETGMSAVNLTLTFWKPEDEFEFQVIGRVNNFHSSSNA